LLFTFENIDPFFSKAKADANGPSKGAVVS